MKSRIMILMLSLFLNANGQQSQSPNCSSQTSEERVQHVLTGLGTYNLLRYELMSGSRGNGVHYPWMDRMQQYGIKQAVFRIDFVWESGVKSLKIKKVFFFDRYYEYESIIKDQQLLKRIRKEGLEQELRGAILLRAEESINQMIKKDIERTKITPDWGRGRLQLHLLDDEILPILDDMPWWTND